MGEVSIRDSDSWWAGARAGSVGIRRGHRAGGRVGGMEGRGRLPGQDRRQTEANRGRLESVRSRAVGGGGRVLTRAAVPPPRPPACWARARAAARPRPAARNLDGLPRPCPRCHCRFRFRCRCRCRCCCRRRRRRYRSKSVTAVSLPPASWIRPLAGVAERRQWSAPPRRRTRASQSRVLVRAPRSALRSHAASGQRPAGDEGRDACPRAVARIPVAGQLAVFCADGRGRY